MARLASKGTKSQDLEPLCQNLRVTLRQPLLSLPVLNRVAFRLNQIGIDGTSFAFAQSNAPLAPRAYLSVPVNDLLFCWLDSTRKTRNLPPIY